MTAVAVSLVLTCALLVALVLVLRFLERRDARAGAALTASMETELREALKAATDRISRLEMARVVR